MAVQGWAKEWALGCVNSPPPAARGGFTQPRAHYFAQSCIPCVVVASFRFRFRPALSLSLSGIWILAGPLASIGRKWPHFINDNNKRPKKKEGNGRKGGRQCQREEKDSIPIEVEWASS